jgi:hypothetical protein
MCRPLYCTHTNRQPSDWVTNAAVRYITTTFAALKERRLHGYKLYINSLPYYREYRQYQGRPPIYPQALQQLRAQLVHADRELQRGINEDWKACVLKYPEVLDHYYSQVIVEIPRGTVDTPFNGHGAPSGSAATVFSGGSGGDRKSRRGGRASAPPPGMGFAPPPPDDVLVNRRHSQRHSRRDSGSYVLSGGKKPTAPMPPAPGYGNFF